MGGRRALAASLALALCTRCASYGSHLSATPVSPGSSELSLAADVLLIDRGFGPQLLPNPEVGLRLGSSEHVDIGGRVNLGSVEANARIRVLNSRRLELTLVPGVGFGFVPATNSDAGLFNVSGLGALLTGINLTARSQLVIGARGVATYAFPLTTFSGDASGARMIYSAGGVLGFRLPLGEKSYLSPELNVLVPYDTDRAEWQFPIFQAGVSYQF
jgi:hypothetical protein